jgi:TonB family protein
MRRFVLGVIAMLIAVAMLTAAAALAAEPLMVRVAVYQRMPQLAEDGSAADPQLPGTLVAAPEGGWPASYDAVRQTLAARKKGRMNVIISAIHAPKPLSAESAAFFIGELGHAVEMKADGDVLLPIGKHTTIPVTPNTTTIFGAPDEQTYIAVTLLPAAAARDDVIVIMNGEKPLGVVSRVEPKYPSIEALKHRTGMVLTQLRVEPDGSVGAVNVLEKGQPQIDAAAVDALKQWRFEPPTRDGRPVTAYMIMSTAYRIE